MNGIVIQSSAPVMIIYASQR